MKKIKSRFAPSAFFGVAVLSSIMLGLLVIVTSFVCEELDKGDTLEPVIIFLVVSVFGCAIFMVYSLSVSLRRLTISDEGVRISSQFKSVSYRWEELCEVEASGKYLWANSYYESIKFVPNEGARVYIPYNSFVNMAEICQALEHIKLQIANGESPTLSSFRYEKEERVEGYVESYRFAQYGKSHIFSLCGAYMILFCGCSLKMASLFVKLHATASFNINFTVGYFVIMSFVLALAMISQMFYFEVSDTYLVVRNPMLPLYKRVYPLSDISVVDLEHHYRQSRSLRVVTNKFNSTIHPAGTLGSKEWAEMFRDLRCRGVNTRMN